MKLRRMVHNQALNEEALYEIDSEFFYKVAKFFYFFLNFYYTF